MISFMRGSCALHDSHAVLQVPQSIFTEIMFRIFKTTIAATALSTTLAFAAHAQSSSGNIMGEAFAGDTVTITSVDAGFKRELKIEKDGRYQVRRVPTGSYDVYRVRKDGTYSSVQTVTVRPGGTARVSESPKEKPMTKDS